MGVIRLGGTTETAFGFIATRIAKMPGRIGDRSAIFTRIGHFSISLIIDSLSVLNFTFKIRPFNGKVKKRERGLTAMGSAAFFLPSQAFSLNPEEPAE